MRKLEIVVINQLIETVEKRKRDNYIHANITIIAVANTVLSVEVQPRKIAFQKAQGKMVIDVVEISEI